jgi:hypothetical protein
MTNAQVVVAAWPQVGCYLGLVPNNNNCPLSAAELIAEEYSVVANFPDTVDNNGNTIVGSDGIFIPGADAILGCTMAYVNKMTTNGVLPQNAALAQIMYTTADGTNQSHITTYGCDGSVTHAISGGFPYP